MIYTTNAIESVNMQLRKVIKNRGHFPNDEAEKRLIYLVLSNIRKNGRMLRVDGIQQQGNLPYNLENDLRNINESYVLPNPAVLGRLGSIKMPLKNPSQK